MPLVNITEKITIPTHLLLDLELFNQKLVNLRKLSKIYAKLSKTQKTDIFGPVTKSLTQIYKYLF